MKVTGIIMECNPFHEGHAHIIKEARRLTGADYIIAAMSGDFVQRGEPAVFDKYYRAAQILAAGADLVLELPLYTACGSAELFARGGICLLDRLGVVTDLCFGSEGSDTAGLQRCARMVSDLDNSSLFREHLQRELKNGLSFPAARSRALHAAASAVLLTASSFQETPAIQGSPSLHESPSSLKSPSSQGPSSLQSASAFQVSSSSGGLSAFQGSSSLQGAPSFQGLPSTPNDLLAVEYCRALLSMDSGIRPHAVSRICVPSATVRRKELLRTRSWAREDPCSAGTGALVRQSPGVSGSGSGQIPPAGIKKPEYRKALLSGISGFPVGPDDFSAQLLYALQMQQEELDSFVDVSADLADRIRNRLPQYRTFSGFLDLVKTKNVTRTRVSRVLLHILLQIRKDRLTQLQSAGTALYARPLALRKSAAPLLSALQKNARIPFLPKLAAAERVLSPEAYSFLQEEIRAEDLYELTLHGLDPSMQGPAPRAVQRRLFVL